MESEKAVDIFGIKPFAESAKILTKGMVDGAGAFLSRICLPAAEEFGLLIRDKVHAYRADNLGKIVTAAEKKLEANGQGADTHAHPRVVFTILEEGSWIEDAVVQDLWAGLLASCCTSSGDDDSNLLFVRLLSDLTKLQAKLMKFVCEGAEKEVAPNGLILPKYFFVQWDQITDVSGESDIQRLDREIDHLRGLELIHGGLQFGNYPTGELTPTALAIHMYVRCQGSRMSPIEYFGLIVPDAKK